jgi:hypothetical protein
VTTQGLFDAGVAGTALPLFLSVTAAMSLLLLAAALARRRSGRESEPASAVAGAGAGSGAAAIAPVPLPDDGPIPMVRPLPPMRELIPPVNPDLLNDEAGGSAEPNPDEAGIPRWLRPSVREARFAHDRDHRRSGWG